MVKDVGIGGESLTSEEFYGRTKREECQFESCSEFLALTECKVGVNREKIFWKETRKERRREKTLFTFFINHKLYPPLFRSSERSTKTQLLF